MSLLEVINEIEAAGKREKRRQEERLEEVKIQAGLLHKAAQLVGVAVGIGFGSKKSFPSPEQAFPNLFKPETEQGQTAEAVPVWKHQQAGMAAYVAAYNEEFKRRKEAAKANGGTGGGNPGQGYGGPQAVRTGNVRRPEDG